MRRFAPAVGIVLFVLQVQSAFAHATPVEYIPASSSILAEAPSVVRVRFSERIEPGASGLTVYGPDGARVNRGFGAPDPGDRRVFSVPLTATGAGTYTVSWQVVSADDGHFTKGAYVFSVGKETGGVHIGGGQFQIQHRSSWPEALTIWLELLGQAILLGCLALIAVLWRPMRKAVVTEDTERLVLRRIRLLIGVAGICIIGGTVAYLLLKSAHLSADRAVSMAVAVRQFLSTVAGRYTLYRLGEGVIVTALFLAELRRILSAHRRTAHEIMLWILLIGIAVMRARVSHAAASPFLPLFSIGMNAVHLLFKDLWIGGLVALIVAFLPALERERKTRLTTATLLRFSNLLLLGFAGGGVTGAYITWLHLKSPANLFTTHWGGYFLALGTYGLVFFILRMYQQRVVLPALAKACDGNGADAAREQSMHLILLAEMFTGVAVLLFSAFMIITTPPLSSQHFYEQSVDAQNATVTFGEHHFEKDQFLIAVRRKDAPPSGWPASSGAVLTVTLENADKGIGPIVAETQMRFPGGFVFPRSTLSAPGQWTVAVTEHESRGYDAVGEFRFRYPEDLDAVDLRNKTHGFGVFEAVMIVVALGILALAWMLWRQNRRMLWRALAATHPADLPSFSIEKPFIAVPITFAMIVVIGFMFGGHNHAGGSFVKGCARSGGLWHESVPIRHGRAVSDVSVLGCMVGDGGGQFHFADEREFAWFVRRESTYASMSRSPSVIVPGKPVTLTFALTDEEGKPVRDLLFEHDRILHVMVVHEDLQTFAHVHPEDIGPVTPQMLASSTFPVSYTFPKAGKYLIRAEWTVRSQTFSQEFTVQAGVPDKTSKKQDPEANPPIHRLMGVSQEFAAENLHVRLIPPSSPLVAGTVHRLRYEFTDGDGNVVTDLEPYLSAAMHISLVKTDLSTLVHTHAELPQTWWDAVFNRRDKNAKHAHVFLPERFGPELVAYALFPTAGEYVVFGEVNRGEKIILTRFVVTVE